MAFASSAFETLAQYLNFAEDASNLDGAVIKVNTLKCMNYFVTGFGFFSQAGGLQAQTAMSGSIALRESELQRDQDSAERL